MVQLSLLFFAATVTGYLFNLLRVPVAWLLGPMLVGVAAAAIKGKAQPLHPGYIAVGQAILGLVTGVGFPLATLKAAAVHGLPLLLAVVTTGALSLLNGYLLWRWAGVDRATGLMGSLPGAASAMVAMADEMGADAVAVALLQYLRLMLVVFLAPQAVHLIFPGGNAQVATTSTAALPAAPVALNLVVLALCGIVGTRAGRPLRLPSPNFLGPLLVALAVSWTLPYQWHMPSLVWNGGMVLVGLSIGVRFDLPMARRLGRAVLVETALVLVLIGLSLGVGYAFHLATGVQPLTAVLGSTPGGMDVMVASAVALGGDAGMVLAMQMTRWFLILLTGPWVAVRLGAGKSVAQGEAKTIPTQP